MFNTTKIIEKIIEKCEHRWITKDVFLRKGEMRDDRRVIAIQKCKKCNKINELRFMTDQGYGEESENTTQKQIDALKD